MGNGCLLCRFSEPFGYAYVGVNINFIICLYYGTGIVDDAIVIGESASTEIERKGHSTDNDPRGEARGCARHFWGTDYHRRICAVYVHRRR